MHRKWRVREEIPHALVKRFPDLNPVILQILYNRGLKTKDEIESFLRSDWNLDILDPFLFQDMEKAVDIIFSHIEQGSRIVVFGDYDADGVCGSAIVYLTLRHIGAQNVEIYIPHREFEGYGLNQTAIQALFNKNTSLIITVDLGIGNIEEIEFLHSKGIKSIVIDHHTVLKDSAGRQILPVSDAIIHSGVEGESYPYKHLSGTGTAFKVAQALLQKSGKDEKESFAKWLLDLVAIGTIADMVPLTGENRVLVKYGLKVLNKTRRMGLRMLIEKSGLMENGYIDPSASFNLNAWNVAFQIAPRLNAAGRLNHAREALELILSEDSQEAYDLAQHLNDVNRERQQVSDQVYQEAMEIIGDVDGKSFLFAKSSNWPVGVLGIVAGRIANTFNKPVVLLTEFRGLYHGSGRSVEGFDITKALSRFEKYLTSYGGHSGACGLSLKEENIDEFVEAFSSYLDKKMKDADLTPILDIDVNMPLNRVDEKLIEDIENLEPFGQDNPEPLFTTGNLIVDKVETVGSGDKHLRVYLREGDSIYKFMGFGMKDYFSEQSIDTGSRVDVVYTLSFNEWRGNKEIQFKIKDIRRR